jgi:lysophospholipase L1-like esterase
MIAVLIALALCGAPSTVAFGDSITVGYGARTQAAMWVNRLGVAVDNRAVAGSTVAEQVEQIREYQGEATEALWFSCTNDLFAQTPVVSYTTVISEGVSLLRARGLTIYLGTCPALKERPGLPSNWRELHAGYNRGLKTIPGVTLVDVDGAYDAETQEATFLPYHPSDAGHAAIASAFLSALHRSAYLPFAAGR